MTTHSVRVTFRSDDDMPELRIMKEGVPNSPILVYKKPGFPSSIINRSSKVWHLRNAKLAGYEVEEGSNFLKAKSFFALAGDASKCIRCASKTRVYFLPKQLHRLFTQDHGLVLVPYGSKEGPRESDLESYDTTQYEVVIVCPNKLCLLKSAEPIFVCGPSGIGKTLLVEHMVKQNAIFETDCVQHCTVGVTPEVQFIVVGHASDYPLPDPDSIRMLTLQYYRGKDTFGDDHHLESTETPSGISGEVSKTLSEEKKYLLFVTSSIDESKGHWEGERGTDYSYTFHYSSGFQVNYQQKYGSCRSGWTSATFGERYEFDGDTFDLYDPYIQLHLSFVPPKNRYVYYPPQSNSIDGGVDYLYDEKKQDLVEIIYWSAYGEDEYYPWGKVEPDYHNTLEEYNRWSTIFRGIVLFKIMAKKRKERLMEKLYAPGGKGMMRCAEEFACCTLSGLN